MFVSFLMPHVDRGAGPLFHLIMLLQMSRFSPDEICFIGDDAYFAEEHVPFGEELALGTIRFTCVSQERFQAYRKAALPFAAVAALYENGRSHLDAFQSLLTVDHPPLGDAILAGLDALAIAPETIEAFLTWSNCPSLSAFAARIGKPVIHNEIGPLRGPAYQDTVYFDFQGVNGNSTPATWHDRAALAAQFDGVSCLPPDGLRQLLYCAAAPDPAAAGEDGAVRYPLGVALQVEDDSNTLAYGRGYDAIRLLYQSQRNRAPEQVLVRSHPGARMGYRSGLGEPDDSPSSLAFLQRIDRLVTINSSVAAEAALWGVPYTVLGDTPFAVLSTPLDASAPALAAPAAGVAAPVDATHTAALNALLVAYLVPATLLFDPDYYRWRLGGAGLRDCYLRHLEVFKRHVTHVRERLPVVAPAAERPAPPAQGTPQRNPALWTATRSLSRSTAALQEQVAALRAENGVLDQQRVALEEQQRRLEEQQHRLEEQHRIAAQRCVVLEAELATAITERDKNWNERCWFQTNFERTEQEIEQLRGEHDTLRFALARQQGESNSYKQSLDVAREQGAAAQASIALALKAQLLTAETFAAESQALQARYDETERTLATMHARFDALNEELLRTRGRHATAEAQSNALIEELNRTLLERIEVLARDEALRRAHALSS